MKKYWILTILIGLSQLGFGQERGKKVMEQVEAQKVAYFTQTLNLTVEESQVFWPVYNEYQDKVRAMKKQFAGNGRVRNMSDEEAARAIGDFLAMQEEELQLKKQLYADLKMHIPPSKLVILQYAENQFKQKLLERIKKRRESRN